MTNSKAASFWKILTSLKLAIVLLAMMMALVVACTLAQVDMGTNGAVNHYMRSFVVWWHPPGLGWLIPVFPGGTTVGLLLAINLITAQLRRLTLSWSKSGLWITHAGLILLVAGEFVSAMYQIDAQMAIEEGQTIAFIERPREFELAVRDTTDAKFDEVYGVPQDLLASQQTIAVTGTPLTIKMHGFMRNADLGNRDKGAPPAIATAGVGPGVAVRERPVITSDEGSNTPVAYVEPVAGQKSFGTWLVSPALGAPQEFIHEGHTYALSLRPRREYLDYSMTLKKFSHDVYAGTDIPKNFSSLVHLENKVTGEHRDALIFMNQPLRYQGKTFYQASFGKNDTLSILQVVQNPGWLLPYISCALVTLGLLIHFAIVLARSQKKRRKAPEAA